MRISVLIKSPQLKRKFINNLILSYLTKEKRLKIEN